MKNEMSKEEFVEYYESYRNFLDMKLESEEITHETYRAYVEKLLSWIDVWNVKNPKNPIL